jgi:hypothetical protein
LRRNLSLPLRQILCLLLRPLLRLPLFLRDEGLLLLRLWRLPGLRFSRGRRSVIVGAVVQIIELIAPVVRKTANSAMPRHHQLPPLSKMGGQGDSREEPRKQECAPREWRCHSECWPSASPLP